MSEQNANEAQAQAQSLAVVPRPEAQLLTQALSDAQVTFLLQRTPRHEIKQRPGKGGKSFSYVEHGYVTELLNKVFGFNWDFEVVSRERLDDEVMVEALLTVRTPAGQTIRKTQFGGAEIKRDKGTNMPLSIADDYKAAASDALKKCASLLGIGLDLYGRDRPEEAPAEPVQLARTFRGRWRQLRDLGWTDAQIEAQYRLVANGRFEDLPDTTQEAVMAQLADMLTSTLAEMGGRP